MKENYDVIRKFFGQRFVVYDTRVVKEFAPSLIITESSYLINGSDSYMFVKINEKEVEVTDFNRVHLLYDINPIDLIKLTIELVFMQDNKIKYLQSQINTCKY